jgi:dipeptidyl aminopeptidase/acylaminoacyl peptidase
MCFLYIFIAFFLIGPEYSYAQSKPLFTIDDYFDIVSLSVADMTKDGQWLACTQSTRLDWLPRDNFRYGDPTYIAPFQADVLCINTKTGKQTKLFSTKKQVRALTWSPDGKMLAFFIMEKGEYRLKVWHRSSGKFENINVSKSGAVASNSHLAWSSDGKKLFFALRASDWKKKCLEMFKTATKGPIIVHDTDNPFLMWDKIRRQGSLRIPVCWDRTNKKIKNLLPETRMLSTLISKDGSFMVFERDITEKTDYDIIFGTTNQLEVLFFSEDSPKILMKKYQRRRYRWTDDSTMLAYSDKGDVFVMNVTDKEPRNLTEEKKEEKKTDKEAPAGEGEKKEKKKQRFSVISFSPAGAWLLCSSTRINPEKGEPGYLESPPPQYWLINAQTGEKKMLYELDEDQEKRPSLRFVDWSPDGGDIYFSTSAPDRYDRGIVRLNIKSRKMTDLLRSEKLYRRWRMSEDGSTFIFTRSDGDNPDDWHVTDTEFSNSKKLTDLNPKLKGKALSHTELISYRDTDGRKLYGVLYYPANYEKGKKYPLITEVYERYFDNGFNSTLNIFTSAGYAVLHPSVHLITGYPGEAWAKGALSAINKVIEMGVADPDRLGIQGTSYGGYATVLLISQTDRFKAAINNSGKVDMISFYTQSPRIGVRNTHAPEKSQDRIGGTMWEYPERYLAHSAILFADRINTPLLCITGDQDHNVEELQSQEIYYALRRLGKKAVWVRYHYGAHGGPQTSEERKDMYSRMLEWYDKYLKNEGKATKGEKQ